jgi:hypothetical protein
MSAETTENNSITANEVRRRVLALGMNSIHRSYDRELKQALDKYILSNVGEVMSYWTLLDMNLKVQVVQLHEEKIVAALGGKLD